MSNLHNRENPNGQRSSIELTDQSPDAEHIVPIPALKPFTPPPTTTPTDTNSSLIAPPPDHYVIDVPSTTTTTTAPTAPPVTNPQQPNDNDGKDRKNESKTTTAPALDEKGLKSEADTLQAELDRREFTHGAYEITTPSMIESARFGTGGKPLLYAAGAIIHACLSCCCAPCCCKDPEFPVGPKLSGWGASAMKAFEAGVGNISSGDISAARLILKSKPGPKTFERLEYEFSWGRPLEELLSRAELPLQAKIRGTIAIALGGLAQIIGGNISYGLRVLSQLAAVDKELFYFGIALIELGLRGKVGDMQAVYVRNSVTDAITRALGIETTQSAEAKGKSYCGNSLKRWGIGAVGLVIILADLCSLAAIKQALESDAILVANLTQATTALTGIFGARSKAEAGKKFWECVFALFRISLQLPNLLVAHSGPLDQLSTYLLKWQNPNFPTTPLGALEFLFSNVIGVGKVLRGGILGETSAFGTVAAIVGHNSTKTYPEHVMSGLVEAFQAGTLVKSWKSWAPATILEGYLAKDWEKTKRAIADAQLATQAQTLEQGGGQQLKFADLVGRITIENSKGGRDAGTYMRIFAEIIPSITLLASDESLQPAEKDVMKFLNKKIESYDKEMSLNNMERLFGIIAKKVEDFSKDQKNALPSEAFLTKGAEVQKGTPEEHLDRLEVKLENYIYDLSAFYDVKASGKPQICLNTVNSAYEHIAQAKPDLNPLTDECERLQTKVNELKAKKDEIVQRETERLTQGSPEIPEDQKEARKKLLNDILKNSSAVQAAELELQTAERASEAANGVKVRKVNEILKGVGGILADGQKQIKLQEDRAKMQNRGIEIVIDGTPLLPSQEPRTSISPSPVDSGTDQKQEVSEQKVPAVLTTEQQFTNATAMLQAAEEAREEARLRFLSTHSQADSDKLRNASAYVDIVKGEVASLRYALGQESGLQLSGSGSSLISSSSSSMSGQASPSSSSSSMSGQASFSSGSTTTAKKDGDSKYRENGDDNKPEKATSLDNKHTRSEQFTKLQEMWALLDQRSAYSKDNSNTTTTSTAPSSTTTASSSTTSQVLEVKNRSDSDIIRIVPPTSNKTEVSDQVIHTGVEELPENEGNWGVVAAGRFVLGNDPDPDSDVATDDEDFVDENTSLQQPPKSPTTTAPATAFFGTSATGSSSSIPLLSSSVVGKEELQTQTEGRRIPQ